MDEFSYEEKFALRRTHSTFMGRRANGWSIIAGRWHITNSSAAYKDELQMCDWREWRFRGWIFMRAR